MTQAFAIGLGRVFSGSQLDDNRHLYKLLRITNAVRSQFDYEGYEQLFEENLTVGMKAIEGRWR
jgi:hypothetical protein